MSDTWPQRARFRELVRTYVTRNGLTNDQVAPLLGIKPQSLQKYLYGNTKRPGREVLVKAAEVFRCRLGAGQGVTIYLKPGVYILSAKPLGACGGGLAEVEARVEAADPPTYRLSSPALGGDTLSRTAF